MYTFSLGSFKIQCVEIIWPTNLFTMGYALFCFYTNSFYPLNHLSIYVRKSQHRKVNLLVQSQRAIE